MQCNTPCTLYTPHWINVSSELSRNKRLKIQGNILNTAELKKKLLCEEKYAFFHGTCFTTQRESLSRNEILTCLQSKMWRGLVVVCIYSKTVFKSHYFVFLIYTFTAGPGATSSITCAQILMTFSRWEKSCSTKVTRARSARAGQGSSCFAAPWFASSSALQGFFKHLGALAAISGNKRKTLELSTRKFWRQIQLSSPYEQKFNHNFKARSSCTV